MKKTRMNLNGGKNVLTVSPVLSFFLSEAASSGFGAAAGGAGRSGGAGNGVHFGCGGVGRCQDRGVFVCLAVVHWCQMFGVCLCVLTFVCCFPSSVDPNRKCSTILEQLIQESRWRSMRGNAPIRLTLLFTASSKNAFF